MADQISDSTTDQTDLGPGARVAAATYPVLRPYSVRGNGKMSPPAKSAVWRFVDGVPGPLPEIVADALTIRPQPWPGSAIRNRWPWWCRVWRRPTSETFAGDLAQLAAAQAEWDAALDRLATAELDVTDQLEADITAAGLEID